MVQYFTVQLNKLSLLKSLNIIHQTGLKMSIGNPKGSQIKCIFIVACEMSLKYRRKKLLLTFAALNSSENIKPTCDTIFNRRLNNTFDNKTKLIQPIYRWINKLSTEHQINFNRIINHETLSDSTPWKNEKLSLAKYNQKTYTHNTY